MPSEITLFGSMTSPYARHCRIALIESEIDCLFKEANALSSSKLSPTQRTPFLSYKEDGKEHLLSDSTAILSFIRRQQDLPFVEELDQLNDFCAANTLLDTAINLFFLEKAGLDAGSNSYIRRQCSRIESGLADFENKLETTSLSAPSPYNDAQLRLACFLDWALFRNRISLDALPKLQSFLDSFKNYPAFADTQPKD